ncbi:hypothetical protein MNBD_GAMMA07-1457 [hydrothermal vent metagenome]|uniref:Uncharacterized protein n=1 Tax=hydrothermal vent metagenome TaxID=652676 RepID=A0A3B0XC97_9ZZZZ
MTLMISNVAQLSRDMSIVILTNYTYSHGS